MALRSCLFWLIKVFVVLNMGKVLREMIQNGKLKKKIYRILRERTGV